MLWHVIYWKIILLQPPPPPISVAPLSLSSPKPSPTLDTNIWYIPHKRKVLFVRADWLARNWIVIAIHLQAADETKSRVKIKFPTISHYIKRNKLIAELAERSPIIIQHSSNPSSRKNLDVRPCDRTRCYFWLAWSTVPRARQRLGFVQLSSGQCTGLRVGRPGF